MRGTDERSGSLFSYVDLETRVPKDHPLRAIREIANGALLDLSADFEAMYAPLGRPSIPPEKLLRALLLQIFFSVRSEPMLLEQLRYNLLFRWFVGLGMDDPIWDVSTFSKNRRRFLDGEISAKFFNAVLDRARQSDVLSDEHFTVDGTLLEAWASHKSFKRKDGGDDPPDPGRNPKVNFSKQKRRNETHASVTDPDARIFRKGPNQGAVLAYMGHALMENRHGLIVAVRASRATGSAEREAAVDMLGELPRGFRATVGAAVAGAA